MQVIKTVLVDDEQGNIVTLTEILNKYCPAVQIVATESNVLDAYAIIQQHNPQLVFLDIEMPNGSGFDLLTKFASINFSVVFVTAFNHYAIKAIKFAAVDYILKPVAIEEIQQAIEKVSAQITKHELNTRIENLLHNIQPAHNQAQRITIPTIYGYMFENIENIMYLEAQGSYANIYLANKQKVVTTRSIKELEELLPLDIFCRIHNSFIVNTKFVSQYHRSGRSGIVIMTDNTEIEISVRKKDEFLKML